MLTALSLEQAVAALIQEKIIAYPTETFYAVGGLALSPSAAEAVFTAKKRPDSQPLPIIIGEIEQLPLLASTISDAAFCLAQTFWPGPLSILFPAGPLLPRELLCASREIAVRLTPHPAAAELSRRAGPLSASSANISGSPAITDPALLEPELFSHLSGAVILPPKPGGGLPSTLVRVLDNQELQIIRNGALDAARLTAAGWRIVS